MLAAGHDTAAFEELVRRHQHVVRQWLLRISGDRFHADDLAQDTFIKAWHAIGTCRDGSKFRQWLLRIAWHGFLQAIRRGKSRERVEEAFHAVNPDTGVWRDDQSAPEIERLLGILSVEERACMLLNFSYGYSHGEISAMLSLPLGTVKSHIRRSIRAIRDHFSIQDKVTLDETG